MNKWRIWYSTRSFADFIVANTWLKDSKEAIDMKQLSESDASKGATFHKVPDHIKRILYLDAPDIIVEYNSEPVLCIEETKEAGTGHDPFQRFARIAAAVENNVPAIYIMPEATIVKRSVKKNETVVDSRLGWDSINPMVFRLYNQTMDIFKVPTFVFYYPSDYRTYKDKPQNSPHLKTKGIIYNDNFVDFPACPTTADDEMRQMFRVIDTILENAKGGAGASALVDKRIIRERQYWMQQQLYTKLGDKNIETRSPITATKTIETGKLLALLSRYAQLDAGADVVSELLASRPKTVVYQCDATFRADLYAGTLCTIDYLLCREGKTFEDREKNLVLCFGKLEEDENAIKVRSNKCSIDDFMQAVYNSGTKNLLTTRSFKELSPSDISRYYMQVRHGSTYSKAKHIRIFSYFADAIIFTDGALWREA